MFNNLIDRVGALLGLTENRKKKLVFQQCPIRGIRLSQLGGGQYRPMSGSLTDCVHLINHSQIPTINLGADIESAHSADEFVTVDQLIDLTKTIALSIMRWSGVRESAGA
jgi:hypothetical protein